MMSQSYFLSNDTITTQLKRLGISNWNELIQHIRHLQYGRNSNRHDLSLVLKEQKGSCSSKHALLKLLADRNKIPDVGLIIGIYKMNPSNTPKIGDALNKTGLKFIPEAHCYLRVKGERIDCTSPNSSIQNIEKDILQEQTILPDQVVEFKIDYHRNYLKEWIQKEGIQKSFEEIWSIREKCIENLSLNK